LILINSKEQLILKYTGVLASENSEIKIHIKTRNIARNRFYCAFIELLKFTAISCKTELLDVNN
jgi:predicted NAD/FAD-binding protein